MSTTYFPRVKQSLQDLLDSSMLHAALSHGEYRLYAGGNFAWATRHEVFGYVVSHYGHNHIDSILLACGDGDWIPEHDTVELKAMWPDIFE